jgi:hypothetical protein
MGFAVAEQYAPASFAFALGRLRRGIEPSALTSELRAAAERHHHRLQQIVSEHARGHRSCGIIGWQDIAAETHAAWAPIGSEQAPPDLRVLVCSTREDLDEENADARFTGEQRDQCFVERRCAHSAHHDRSDRSIVIA